MNEDNFYIKYFCKYIENEMKHWEKQYYGLKRGRNIKYKRCNKCARMIEKTNNRILYCKECYTKLHNKDAKNRMKRYRERRYLLEKS